VSTSAATLRTSRTNGRQRTPRGICLCQVDDYMKDQPSYTTSEDLTQSNVAPGALLGPPL
jgi:hypothetical protein